MQCRFAGHTREFYSVAQHCVHVSEIVEPRSDALWGLLHDAAEAYLVDLPRQVKRTPGMEGYILLEQRWTRVISMKFALGGVEAPRSVKRADEILLATEARDLMPAESVRNWSLREGPTPLLDLRKPWAPAEARNRFLQRFAELAMVPDDAEVFSSQYSELTIVRNRLEQCTAQRDAAREQIALAQQALPEDLRLDVPAGILELRRRLDAAG